VLACGSVRNCTSYDLRGDSRLAFVDLRVGFDFDAGYDTDGMACSPNGWVGQLCCKSNDRWKLRTHQRSGFSVSEIVIALPKALMTRDSNKLSIASS
jgi:hypothetical protein